MWGEGGKCSLPLMYHPVHADEIAQMSLEGLNWGEGAVLSSPLATMSVPRHGCSREVCELVANLNHNHQPIHTSTNPPYFSPNPPQPSAHPSTPTTAICTPVHSPIYLPIHTDINPHQSPLHTHPHTHSSTLLCLIHPLTHPFTDSLYTSTSCQMSSHIITQHPFRIQN